MVPWPGMEVAVVARARGRENGECLLNGYEVPFWGDEHVLEINSGDANVHVTNGKFDVIDFPTIKIRLPSRSTETRKVRITVDDAGVGVNTGNGHVLLMEIFSRI